MVAQDVTAVKAAVVIKIERSGQRITRAHFLADLICAIAGRVASVSSLPVKKVRSWLAIRLHAVPCTRAMKGNGTSAPIMAEVPVTFVPTVPAVFACFRSQMVAS